MDNPKLQIAFDVLSLLILSCKVLYVMAVFSKPNYMERFELNVL